MNATSVPSFASRLSAAQRRAEVEHYASDSRDEPAGQTIEPALFAELLAILADLGLPSPNESQRRSLLWLCGSDVPTIVYVVEALTGRWHT